MGRKKKKKKHIPKIFTAKFFIWVFLSLFFLLSFGGICYKIYRADFFKIDARSLESNLKLKDSITKKIKGKLIFNLDLGELRLYLEKQYPGYKNIRIFKKFPNNIEIQADKRKAVAQMRQKKFYLVDQDGVVVNQGSENHLKGFPIITNAVSDRYLTKGENIYNQNLAAAFRLIKIIEDKGLLDTINSLNREHEFELSDINISSSKTIYFYLTNQKYYQSRIKIILNRQELEEKIDILSKLIDQKLGDKMSLIRYIDFRFQKVAVGFKR
ncbi:MAG: cell division protein FtsQ/DivIB [Candidatus Omnitrophica bacterium]|nr:cell division protein FtsQ/DivIB [Candidatus Omnitrophota bacterium]MCF7877033.1 cell division protein FtsQ/DivIB [Candidatus Omnitrophota bacterium]MCF7877847.1 cell division protein FtsQ/DivIB [Candidatus Omnitrophota bacterium]MCF7892539.1 cell division protein FtsQ/DivIB [Candidatus Omnitrophota bacterium]